MSIKYEPSKLIKNVRLRERASALVTDDFKVSRAAVRAISDIGLVPEKVATQIALQVAKDYRERARAGEAPTDKALLESRVQAAALRQQTAVIKRAYEGERYEWLPSTAANPRDEHIPNYGKIFVLGVGDDDGNDPGDLINCQCGMRILTDDTPAEFNDRLEELL